MSIVVQIGSMSQENNKTGSLSYALAPPVDLTNAARPDMVFSSNEPDRPYRAVCSQIQAAMAEPSRLSLTTIHPEGRIEWTLGDNPGVAQKARFESTCTRSTRLIS